MTERQVAVQIVEKLQKNGFSAVFAGGCVRDQLLGHEPKDIDIATSATPDEVEALFRKTVPVGKAFGVVVVLQEGFEFEVATFRRDSKESDGRRPDSVEFSSMEEDAKRRDLTINGMFFDPVKDEVIDFVGGRADLIAGEIRLIGDPQERIDEDRLRMLRVLRFAVRYGFVIDDDTHQVVVRNHWRITDISAERIRDELVKMFRLGKHREVLEHLRMSGMLLKILPEVHYYKGCKQNPEFHSEGDVWEHTLRVMEALPSDASEELVWAALLHDVGKPVTTEMVDGVLKSKGHAAAGVDLAVDVLKRLKFSNDFTERVVALVGDHMKPYDVPKMKKSTVRRLLSQGHFEELMQLCEADCKASLRPDGTSRVDDLDEINEKFDRVRESLRDEPVLPEPLVTGKDLIELGYKPGPIFKVILDRIVEEQLEGTLATKEAALEFVKAHSPF